MDETLFDGHDELYQQTKFGEDRTGAKMYCVFFCWSRSESVAPFVRGLHSSNSYCVAVYRPISTRFSAFFHVGLRFQTPHIVLTFVAKWRHNFREIVVKNCEKCKNWRRRLCAPLRIVS